MNQEINNYITKRYERWLDYSRFKCTKAGMNGKECEVMSEVVYSLLKRDESFLLRMLSIKKVQKGKEYTELDFFVLRAIDLNVNSETSPYRHKNRLIPRANIEVSRLKIPDIQEEETDHAGYVFERWNQIREIVYEMGFSQKALAIFEYKFFEDEAFSQWTGTEKPRELYCIYSRITKTLRAKIDGRLLI